MKKRYTLSNTNSSIIYPNPSHSSLNIKDLLEGNYTLEIINTFGKVVLKTGVFQSNNEVRTNSFSKGFYLVKLSKNQNENVKKLIIN